MPTELPYQPGNLPFSGVADTPLGVFTIEELRRIAFAFSALAARLEVVEGDEAAAGTANLYIQPDPPSVAPGVKYAWFQTGLPPAGEGMTLWIEDGT